MQTKKAKYHLKRIKTILSLHEDSLSRLDRDILLEDIRQLYDLVLNHDEVISSQEQQSFHEHLATNPESVIEEPVSAAVTPPAQENKAQVSEPQEPLSKPEQTISSSEPVQDEPKPRTEVTQNQIEPETTAPAVSQEEKVVPPHPSFSNTEEYQDHSASEKMNGTSDSHTSNQPETEEYEDVMVKENESYPELFDFPSTSDLSDRLANTKIEHLNKVLTINDKILFINHLFSGEAIPFQESLKKFEGFYTYEEAKKYASEELVQTYNWTVDEKKETIRQFMRQVKRLYS